MLMSSYLSCAADMPSVCMSARKRHTQMGCLWLDGAEEPAEACSRGRLPEPEDADIPAGSGN